MRVLFILSVFFCLLFSCKEHRQRINIIDKQEFKLNVKSAYNSRGSFLLNESYYISFPYKLLSHNEETFISPLDACIRLEEIKAPFLLTKNKDSDTILITKNDDVYTFLLQSSKD